MLQHGIDYKPSSRVVVDLTRLAFSVATAKYPDAAKLHALNIELLQNRLPNLRGFALQRARQTIEHLQAQLAQAGGQ